MLKHVVMWRLKDMAEGKNKQENSEIMKEMLLSLENEIPEIKYIEVGLNINPTDAAYDIVLITHFNNEEDLKIYANHPEHLKVGEFIGKIRSERVVVDYIE
ncbi:Dabb family protein [Wukongibacter baidiensis]|uniref:Dabb family protein n=1 Tax=Wukongibacter baidiensis TaxID=1723361 RepID=UPI003D7F7500